MSLITVKTMSSRWLSNSWLIADRPGGHAVLVDTGGPTAPILEAIRDHDLTLGFVLCTHHHIDHVAHNAEYQQAFGCPVCGHARERSLFDQLDRPLDRELSDGEELVVGGLHIRAVHIPGHTLGQLGFLINDEHVFTGDTLFRGAIGGTRGVGHTSFEDIQRSILEVLMTLPPATQVYPGHCDGTTIGEEWESNPFVRIWRGLDPLGSEPCTALGEPATLLLRARDYDGGFKCQVRFEDGTVDIVPGSRVELAGGG